MTQPQRRFALAALLALGMAPSLHAALVALGGDWTPVSDWALIDLSVRSVGTDATPLVGAYSRFGWNHPGPWGWYLLALVARPMGASADAVAAATAIVHAAGAAVAIWMGWRRGGPGLALMVMVAVVAMQRSMGAELLIDPWNPHLPVIAVLAFLLALWDAAAGRASSGLVAFVAASVAVQSHVGYAPVVLGATLAILALKTVALRVGTLESLRWRPRVAPGLLVGWWASAVLLWLPTLYDAVAGTGNLGRLVGAWSGRLGAGSSLGADPVGLGAGASLTARDLVTSPRWLLGPMDPFGAMASDLPAFVLAIPFVVASTLAVLAWRRGLPEVVAGQTIALAAVAAGWLGTAAILGPAYRWLTMPLWPVGAYLVVVTIWSVGVLVVTSRVAAPRETTERSWRAGWVAGAVGVGVAVLLVGGTIAAGAGARPPHHEHGGWMEDLNEQAAGRLRADGTHDVAVRSVGGAGFASFGLLDGLDRAGFRVWLPAGGDTLLAPGHVEDPTVVARNVWVVTGADQVERHRRDGPGELIALIEPDPRRDPAGAEPVAVFAGR